MKPKCPSFQEQTEMEHVLRATLTRAHSRSGLPPLFEPELTHWVRDELVRIHREFGADFLKDLATPAPSAEPPRAGFVTASMTETQRDIAEATLWYAKVHGIDDIPAALAWYHTFSQASKSAPSVRRCVQEYLIAKRGERRAPHTLRQYQLRLDHFAARFGDRPPRSISGPELSDYLTHYETLTTRLSHWDTLSVFFNWLARRGHVLENPLPKAIRRPIVKVSPGQIFTPAETKTILRHVKHTDQAGFWALSLFAGLSRHEIESLQTQADPWHWIDLKSHVIDLRAAPFTPAPRRITILPVLHAWLEWIRQEKIPFYPPNHWDKFRLVRALALGGRYANAAEAKSNHHGQAVGGKRVFAMARRSFVSYRLALAGSNFASLSDEVGRHETNIRSKFYRRASQAEAEEYFEITPQRI